MNKKNQLKKKVTSSPTSIKISKNKLASNNNKNTKNNNKNANNKNKNKNNTNNTKNTNKTKTKIEEEIVESVEEEKMQNETMMAMDEIFVKKSGKVDFDKFLDQCLKDRDIFSTMNKNEKKKRNEEYENSFQEIDTFRKSLTKKDIEDINTIVYHDENNDGIFSAVCAYHYYSTTYPNRVQDLRLVPVKPQAGMTFINPRDQEKYKDRNLLILDLDFHPQYVENIKKISNQMIIIDDHTQGNSLKGNKIFVGTNHAACANTFKFFYPKEPIPNVVKIIDISDSKIGLGEYSNYMNHFTRFLGHRFTHNKTMRKDPQTMMNELWNLIFNINMNTALFIGHYMDEAENSLKDQIAINAKPAKFQGYNVAVINFNAPSLLKPVLRQINTNYERMEQPIDFAVGWGWEYTANGYSVTIMDNHRPESTVHLGDIAKKLAKYGGHPKGGSGHPHIGHFYWPKNQKVDIWDLFSKQFI